MSDFKNNDQINDLASLNSDNLPTAHSDSVDEGRRAALKKLGLYGAYTAPALLGLYASTKAAHASPLFPPNVCPPVC